MEIIPKDNSFSDRGFHEACELARSGNDEAVHHLRRFAKRAAGTEQGDEAQRVLSELT